MRRFAVVLVLILFAAPVLAAGPYYPAPRANIKLAKQTRVVYVGNSSAHSDFLTLARAYAWLEDQTRDATHQWVVIVGTDADISSPGAQPTYTSVIYRGNVPSTAAVCGNGQVQTYVLATNSWACGSATTGGAAGAGASVASALVSFADTSGGSLQATGAATLAGNPALGASGLALATTGLIFEGATANTSEGLLVAGDATADRTWTLPDVSGTVGMGPGAATDLALARWDGTSGSLLQDSTLTLSDVGELASAATIGADPALGSNGVTFGTTGLIGEGSTANTIETLLTFADPAATDKTVTIPATTGTLAMVNGVGSALSFAVAAGGTDIAEITITVQDGAGVTVAAVHHFDVWLSDSATCAGITGTSASGTVQAKAASGRDVVVYTAKKSHRSETLATGVYVLEVTDSAKTGFFVCATAPASGKAASSAQLGAGDYGL